MEKERNDEDAMQSKDFSLGEVLTITTGYLFAPHFFQAVHNILSFMGGSIEDCESHLSKQFPQLFTPEMDKAVAELEKALAGCKKGNAEKVKISTDWLNKQIPKYGEILAVKPLPKCINCGQSHI